jgi:hypothetical protein
MKKAILAIGLTAVLFSCKKREENEFTATDNTGTTVVSGTITRDQLTIATNGTLNTTATNYAIPAEGVNVTVRVKKYGNQGLYPAVNESQRPDGFDSYSATTDANGRYSITVKSNGLGVQAVVTTNDFVATKDTLLGSSVKTGLLNKYTGTNSGNVMLYKGVNYDRSINLTGSPLVNSPNVINAGTAIVTGSIGVTYVKKRTNFNLDTVVALSGATVYLEYDRDPVTLVKKTYMATTDNAGKYTFTVATPNNSEAGFNKTAKVWLNDRAANRDTFSVANTIVTGRAGVYSSVNNTYNNVYSTVIRNAANLTYSSFTVN